MGSPLKRLEPFLSLIQPGIPLDEPSMFQRCCTDEQHFYDKHVGDSHSLKKVVLLPDMASHLRTLSSNAIEDMVAKNLPDEQHSEELELSSWMPQLSGIAAVARGYRSGCGNTAVALTLGTLLAPTVPKWWRIQNFMLSLPTAEDTFSHSRMRIELAHLKNRDGTVKLNFPTESLSPEEHSRLLDLASHCPIIANWQMFAATVHSNKLISNVKMTDNFPWEYCPTAGITPSLNSSPKPPDAPDLPWTKEWIARTGPRRSSRFNKKSQLETLPPPSRVKRPTAKPTTAYIHSKVDPQPDEGYFRTSKHFLQRVWTQSALWDTTFLVLHSGNIERIGIRNRKTQTLYLSDVIHVDGNSDYSRIHHGLCVAAVQDALRRIPLLRDMKKNRQDQREGKRTRSSAEIDGVPPRKKRRRISESHSTPSLPLGVSQSIQTSVSTEQSTPFDKYNTILCSFQFGVYDSPLPLILFRITAPSFEVNPTENEYSKSECISIQLQDIIGEGAISFVHSASISLPGAPPSSSLGVVAKVAHAPEDQKRLERETIIYNRLMAHNVTSVPKFYGLFRDRAHQMTMLVLENVGTPLAKVAKYRCHPPSEDFDDFFLIPSPQREQLLDGLEMIHDAHVVHRDIRPANIGVDDEDNFKLFDFDHGRLDAAPEKYPKDRCDLVKLVDGTLFYEGVSPTPSPERSPRAESSSSGTRTDYELSPPEDDSSEDESPSP